MAPEADAIIYLFDFRVLYSMLTSSNNTEKKLTGFEMVSPLLEYTGT
jgi:hypothetical protein